MAVFCGTPRPPSESRTLLSFAQCMRGLRHLRRGRRPRGWDLRAARSDWGASIKEREPRSPMLEKSRIHFGGHLPLGHHADFSI